MAAPGYLGFSVGSLCTRAGSFFWPVRPVWKLAKVIVVKQLVDCRERRKEDVQPEAA